MAPRFLTSLIPHRGRFESGQPLMQVLRGLTWLQWGHFIAGYIAWTSDAIDFFSVSLSVSHLKTQFNRNSVSDITTAITLTLLLRTAGAVRTLFHKHFVAEFYLFDGYAIGSASFQVIFGILGDRFGRKWPLVANLLVVAALELGSGFVQTFHQFLAVRSLFGIAMGGVWGLASSGALENLPVEVRGLASGVLQQAYAVGYLIAAVINLYLVPEVSAGWRSLFWTGAGISLFAAVLRALLPESDLFLRAKAVQDAAGVSAKKQTSIFIKETREMLKRHWLLCIYAICLMSGLNFLAHGSQDLYPTYLQVSKGMSDHDATVATIIGNCGAIAGGAIAGFSSQYIGRRLTILYGILILSIGAFIPLWILPTGFSALAAGAFWIQFCVQGALGVIPIQLAEMSPPAFRATFPGVVYQLGNMVSSASAQIEATGGNHLKTTLPGKTDLVPDYATVQGILVGAVAAFVVVVVIIGPENHGFHFERYKTAFVEGGGRDEELSEDRDSSFSEIEKASSSRPPSLTVEKEAV
ncbi:hypothetical protein EIP91_001184 [Steccherinum ochraceum]|uniref:Major facilitator superfamily (MFS) profile domain-containing protein n=1 Tax=Steccherinum ochraceum TaxID=92696 RepID=A0A4R0RSM5_9APHY|nr:hypothetical protein EIP91_001184 [Steccherinum ochraceum]